MELAKIEDAPQLVALAVKSFDENKLEEIGFQKDIEKALKLIVDCILNKTVFIKRNELDQKLIEGFIVLEQGEVWFSSESVLKTVIIYIKPEVRSFKFVKDLINEAKKYAIIQKMPLFIDIFGQKDTEKKNKLFKYLGFKNYGSTFVFTVGDTQ